MGKRACRYCGYTGPWLKPSVVIGWWICRNKKACNERYRAKYKGKGIGL